MDTGFGLGGGTAGSFADVAGAGAGFTGGGAAGSTGGGAGAGVGAGGGAGGGNAAAGLTLNKNVLFLTRSYPPPPRPGTSVKRILSEDALVFLKKNVWVPFCGRSLIKALESHGRSSASFEDDVATVIVG